MKIIINEPMPADWSASGYTHPKNLYENILGVLLNRNTQLPVAEMIRRHLNKPEGQWFIVSPIIWEAGHNDVIVKALPSTLNLSEPLVQSYFDAFYQFTRDDFSECKYINRDIWLIESKKMPETESVAPAAMMNQSIMPEIEKLDADLKWSRFLTEIQMLFQDHALKRSIDSTLNGAWVWGCGSELPSIHLKNNIYVNSESLFDLVRIVCGDVQYHELRHTNISPHDILVFDALDDAELGYLLERFKNYRIEWHFNNAIALQKPKNIWWRLLR